MTIITFVLCDQMLATSTTLPIEMFRTAEGAAIGLNRQADRLTTHIAAASLEPVMSSSGIAITPTTTFDQLSQSDLVCLPGLWRNPRHAIKNGSQLIEFIKKMNLNGAMISSAGTGSCFMAEAGLLDGKVATTHWYYFDQFERAYPKVQLKRQYFITQAGRLYCAASINAMADLTVHLIKGFYGEKVAYQVQRHFSHEIRKDYERTGFFESSHQNLADEVIAQIQIWLQDNYANTINFPDLAARFSLTSRTFNRRFKQATGITPGEYLQKLRVDVAQDLLKNTNLSILDIASHVGYHDVSYLSERFKKYLGTTPSAYRTTVRAKLFNA